jgi:hypothetical protein
VASACRVLVAGRGLWRVAVLALSLCFWPALYPWPRLLLCRGVFLWALQAVAGGVWQAVRPSNKCFEQVFRTSVR